MSKKDLMRRLLTCLRTYMGRIILSFVFAIITVVLTLIIPVWIGDAVDCIISVDNVRWDDIWPLLIRIGVAALVSALTTYGMNRCNNYVVYGVVRDLRRDVLSVVNSMPISEIDHHPHGDIVSRVIADADAVGDGLLMGFTNLFTGGITILGTLGFMFWINVPIAVIVVVVTPLSLLVARFIARRSHAGFAAQSEDRGEQTSQITEMCENIRLVQVFHQEEECARLYDETAERLKRDSLSAIFFSSITNPATRFVNSIVYAAVGVCGALVAVRGGITVGMLSAFLSYANQYTKPFNEISGVITELENAFVCAERLFDLMDTLPENYHDSDKVMPEADGRVTIENVYFSYDSDGKSDTPENAAVGGNSDGHDGVRPDEMLIRDFNLSVNPGERVAIVGPTGAGKSTIINLLMRFYDVNGGRICVDGADIRDVSRESLRAGYGMVLQETWIMTGTIRENIAYGKPDASESEIVEAAKAAHANGFISRLPEGYDTLVSDESGLSAGEKQLICIARVMLTLPPMLILDEATSSIDTRTEERIQRAFAKMMRGRTSFVVAHRLQTIRESDVILVMRDGGVVEQGNHEELMRRGGFYAKLYEASVG